MGAPAASRLLLLVGGGFPCADRPRALRVAAAAIELPSCMPSPSSCIVVTSLNRVGCDLARRASEAATSGSDNSSAAEGREGSMPGGVITHRAEEEATQVRAAECRGGGRTHLARRSCIHKYRYRMTFTICPSCFITVSSPTHLTGASGPGPGPYRLTGRPATRTSSQEGRLP